MRCEATTDPTLWWRRSQIDFPQCSRQASVLIDGLHLCLQHAGSIAVQKLIHRGEVINLKQTGPLCDAGQRWVRHMR